MSLLRRFVSANRGLSKRIEPLITSSNSQQSYFDDLRHAVNRQIEQRKHPVVLEIGGVDRPILSRSKDYTFIGVDIEEKPACRNLYDEFIVQTVENPMPIEADVILSITLLEHVPDNKSAFESMYSTLRPGGYMAHYVPSKWHPYSISLRLVGPRLQKKLIAILRPDAVEVTGYPAYFSYCSPSEMIKLAKETGFMNVKTTCYHRANDYFAFFFPAFVVVTLFEELCRKLRWTFFASGFLIEGAKRDG